MAQAASATAVEIDGRQLKLSNLDKVLYPEAGFTKGEVIDYYARVAPTMLAHVGDRGVTLRRYPNGVDAASFFEKRCASHRPGWVPVCLGPGDRTGAIEYCRLDSRAALVWSANMAALEVHAPMARCDDIETPTMVVFDLDPGTPADLHDCCEIALWIADTLEPLGLRSWPKTSGSKGLQLYLPANRRGLTHEQASSFAQAVAQALENHHRDRVTSNMNKQVRTGRVFIDWSQNSRHKTTVAPYSLRARPQPTVSTPVTWEEVEACADGELDLVFEAADVLARVDEHGDLFAETLTVEQDIPAPTG
jgi:bifunctional non-homologous end joining protein LigD